MESLFDDLIVVLKKYNLSKEQIHQWKSIKVDHSKKDGDKKTIMKNFKIDLRQQIGDSAGNKIRGIYAYYDEDSCLYIGKTKDLINRLAMHFSESKLDVVKGDWDKFFGNYRKPLKVYFKSVDSTDENIGEALRIVVERLLLHCVNPVFESFHKSTK